MIPVGDLGFAGNKLPARTRTKNVLQSQFGMFYRKQTDTFKDLKFLYSFE